MVREIATALALMTLVVAPVLAPVRADEARMKVTLVGTGGPEYFPDRLGISTLVEANGEMLLFDVGRGANQRLYQSRVNPKDISKIFLTHLHNDHFEGLPDLWMTPWFLLGRDHGFELWGPEGPAEMVQGMRAMFGHDLKARVNRFNPIETLAIQSHIVSDGVVFERNGVKVTAFPVEHADGNPAFGYQVDWNGRRVVLSGDTTLSENVITHGTGADVIIHNVIAFQADDARAGGRGLQAGEAEARRLFAHRDEGAAGQEGRGPDYRPHPCGRLRRAVADGGRTGWCWRSPAT